MGMPPTKTMEEYANTAAPVETETKPTEKTEEVAADSSSQKEEK